MSQIDFERDWVPRVGEAAARRLARRDNLLLLIPLMCVAAAVALAVLDGVQATSSFAFAIVTLVVAIVVLAIWIRSRILLARDISLWLGVKISWVQLPRMQPSSFDRWCRRRGIAPHDQHQDSDPERAAETVLGASMDTHSEAIEPTASESA